MVRKGLRPGPWRRMEFMDWGLKEPITATYRVRVLQKLVGNRKVDRVF